MMFGISSRNITKLAVALILVVGGLSSCLSPKKVVYFHSIKDSITTAKPFIIDSVTPYVNPVILPNDLLAITIQTIAQNESNLPVQPTKGITDPVSSFMVDRNGMIEISLIGYVKVGGLTTFEARELIKNKAKEFYREPVVNLKIINFDIYYLGDFLIHTNSFPSEKVNILEAVAAGGDIQLTSKKTNLLLIRTEGDTKKLIRFDLTKPDLFRSPYFYLRQRDILYAEPTKFRIQASDNRVTRNLTILSGIVSLATILLAFRNFK